MTTNDNSLFLRFEQRLTAAGGTTHLVATLEQAAQLIASHPALAEHELIIPPGFEQFPTWGPIVPLLHAANLRTREADTPVGIADAPAGLSAAELAVAETGSVLLADNALASRIVGMLTLTHFVLVEESTLYPLLEAASQQLQKLTLPGPNQQHYISLVTGPSRTADIERTLTIGVQGPKALCVIIVTHPGA